MRPGSEAVRPQLDAYLTELTRWGARMNLVGRTAPEDLELHVRDSLAAVDALPDAARVVDLGTGAGFPGLPLAIARPDLDLVLAEIREGRVHFLRHAVRTLGLACEVRRCRIDVAPLDRFQFALARAVGPLPDVLRWSRGWLASDGEAWIWTRIDPADCGVPGATALPIDPETRARGHILRVPASSIVA